MLVCIKNKTLQLLYIIVVSAYTHIGMPSESVLQFIHEAVAGPTAVKPPFTATPTPKHNQQQVHFFHYAHQALRRNMGKTA